MKINIVGGNGAIGSLHADLFESKGHVVYRTDLESALTPIEGAKESDVTIFSVPISQTQTAMRDVAPYAKAIMDLTGVKMLPMNWMAEYAGARNIPYLGGHPLYGPNTDVSSGDETFVITNSDLWSDSLGEIVSTLARSGVQVQSMTPNKHDETMAVVQNTRALVIGVYSNLAASLDLGGLSLRSLSPTPSKQIMDLFERQCYLSPQLYLDMRQYNPMQQKVDTRFIELMSDALANPSRYLR